MCNILSAMILPCVCLCMSTSSWTCFNKTKFSPAEPPVYVYAGGVILVFPKAVCLFCFHLMNFDGHIFFLTHKYILTGDFSFGDYNIIICNQNETGLSQH